jgi:hypothetical protein
MWKESASQLLGNEAFEGFAIELISEIGRVLSKERTPSAPLPPAPEFRHRLKWAEDGAYGSPGPRAGTWDGMLGEVTFPSPQCTVHCAGDVW